MLRKRRSPAVAPPRRQVAGHGPLSVDGKAGIRSTPSSCRRSTHPRSHCRKDIEEAVIEHIVKPDAPAGTRSRTARSSYLINPTGQASSSAARTVTAVSRVARSSSTRTVARRPTAAVRSPARTPRKSTARRLTPRATSRRTSSAPVLRAKCLVQISYAIGIARTDERDGSRRTVRARCRTRRSVELVQEPLRPAAEGHRADARPAASDLPEKTAAYGHFGRDEPEFSRGKQLDKAAVLKADAGL
jgi:hypothetical protein